MIAWALIPAVEEGLSNLFPSTNVPQLHTVIATSADHDVFRSGEFGASNFVGMRFKFVDLFLLLNWPKHEVLLVGRKQHLLRKGEVQVDDCTSRISDMLTLSSVGIPVSNRLVLRSWDNSLISVAVCARGDNSLMACVLHHFGVSLGSVEYEFILVNQTSQDIFIVQTNAQVGHCLARAAHSA